MVSFEEKYKDLGIFTFKEKGFSFIINEISKEKKWSDIEEINVYKLDLYTTDEICMDIVFKETYITFSEETPGWYQLIIKLKEVFKQIPENWDKEIVKPPFATNFKTIYKLD